MIDLVHAFGLDLDQAPLSFRGTFCVGFVGYFISDRLSVLPTVALTPQSAQLISVPPGPIMKPSDTLLILVSKSPRSLSSHVAVPFSAHSGHVTGVTNRSRFAVVASRPILLHTSHPLSFGRRLNAVCNIEKAIAPI
jgi:hypothetical protein